MWANPQELKPALARLPELAAVLDQDTEWLERRITSNLDREFVYLQRHLRPAKAEQVMQLGLPGVGTVREYQRFYPAGEVTGHVVGFTDVDDRGQEGLEAAFDHWLKGENGSKRVLQDRLGHVIGDVELLSHARPGKDLRTSIDLRLQYLAYRELKRAVTESHARSGSVVVLDPNTGEVLAMVNQPSYNPNDRSQYHAELYRNRAVTDIFEPGSSFKPLVLAAALESGSFSPRTMVDTSPGTLSHQQPQDHRGRAQSRPRRPHDGARAVEQRRRRARRAHDGAADDLEGADRLRHRPPERQHVSRRVGRRAERPAALAHDRPGHAVVRLRRRGH